MASRSLYSRVKELITTFPCGCLALTITILTCYYLQTVNHISVIDLCLNSHSVIYDGDVSRILLYNWFHGNVFSLILSVVLLLMFGSLSEKQAGTLRLLYIVFVLSIITALLSMLAAHMLFLVDVYSPGTNTYYAGLGMYAPLFGLMVILFKNSQMKKIILVFFIVKTHWVPWIILILSLLLIPRFNLLFGICGCISGILYSRWLGNWIGLPTALISKVDRIFSPILQCIPCINYVRGTPSNKLPFYHHEVVKEKPHLHLGQFKDYPEVTQATVSQYKLQKLHKMGFPFEQSVVALEAANGNIENAVFILANDQVGPHTIVIPNAMSNGSAIKHS